MDIPLLYRLQICSDDISLKYINIPPFIIIDHGSKIIKPPLTIIYHQKHQAFSNDIVFSMYYPVFP